MAQATLIAIDGGQTSTKVSLGADPVFKLPAIQANREVLPQLVEAVQAATARGGAGPYDVGIGTTCYSGGDHALATKILADCAALGVRRVWVTQDSVTSYLGALGMGFGAVIAAGTGAVTLGVGQRNVIKVDGWGHLFGDAGSGYWFGREAMDAVMRAFDHRGPDTALTDIVRTMYPELEYAYEALLVEPDHVRVIASLAKHVDELSHTDEVSADICRRGGHELALAVATALREVGEADKPSPDVCFLGSILNPGSVRDACLAELSARWPHIHVREPEGDSLAGARMLSHLPADHPLTRMIHFAKEN